MISLSPYYINIYPFLQAASQFSLLLGVFMTFFVIESSEGAGNVVSLS